MALLDNGAALWQQHQQQENDATASVRLRGGKTANENSMATPFLSKQTGKQQSQTAGRKALSNISNINHLHNQSRLQGKAAQLTVLQNKQGLAEARDPRDARARPAAKLESGLDNKMDVLAEQFAHHGIEQPSGLTWEAHEDLLFSAARDQAAARAASIADIISGTAAITLGGQQQQQHLELEQLPPSPSAAGPFTGILVYWDGVECM